jgi:hypothetical protein
METMNKSIKLIGAALTTGIVSISVSAAKPGSTSGDPVYNGNGSPSGSHYTLNILGMDNPKGKTEDETSNSNGRRIFVPLNGKTKILLTEGPYDVIDYDGTDGTAIFQLPNPDPDCDGTTDYSVYARGLGGGGSADITTCADPKTPGNDGDDYCSIGNTVTLSGPKGNGAASFTNVSRQLLYVTGDFGDGVKRYPLFGDPLYDYYWDYDNNGLRLAQLRFYELETVVDTDENTDCAFPVI